MPDITREDIIEAARKVAHGRDNPLTRSDFMRETGITEWQINRHFPEGRWTELREHAGIERHPLDHKEYSDEECLAEFHRVVTELERIPTIAQFEAHANISHSAIKRRFGDRNSTLLAYRDYLTEQHPDSPFLELVSVKSRHEIPAPPTENIAAKVVESGQWAKTDGTEYGAPINFRGLRHAPINEQGVVYLFGMVSYELGLVVESVQSAFPDCEAKRCIDTKRNRWQRVLIEFEYRSSNFREHGHDPSGCDLIVCWEHNWDECPLEVIELRTVIDQLDG